jgi:flavin reductase (DIM6/NTAB) family NADH-FMN oxidoreductase RutF
MEKKKLGNNIFMYPMPVALLGTKMENKANFMALGWVARLNGNPPLLGIGVNRVHHTDQLLRENRKFSINFPPADLIEKVDFCGIASGKDTDKSELFTVYYGDLDVPLIEECTLSLECHLRDIYEMETHDLFIGEIVESYSEKKYLSDGKLDMAKMDPLLLTMPDNNYWKVGEKAGKAWSIGRSLK